MEWKVLPDESCWQDRRLLTVGHNEFAYEAHIPANLEEWSERRDWVRQRILLAAGLLPMPERAPLKPRIWDEFVDHDIRIAKVSFETLPGLTVTGNLYRPVSGPARMPAILSPHGHWPWGRVEDADDDSVPLRCLMLSKLGFVVFAYDMIGYCDNSALMHHWPVSMSRRLSLDGVSPFMMQTWNSLRAVDFICGLPDVDEERIGITGASGGATQCWMVSALEERIKVIAPVCMLSCHYQGGCICEEGPMLRLDGLTSFDIVASCAPRPVILPATTTDWTVLNPRYELPRMRQVYALHGAEDRVAGFQLEAPHNYNRETREHVYAWLCHWLQGAPLQERINENGFIVPEREKLLHGGRTGEGNEEDTMRLGASMAAALRQAGEADRALVASILDVDPNCHDICMRLTQTSWDSNDCHPAEGCLVSRRSVGDVIPGFIVRGGYGPADTATLILPGDSMMECLKHGTPAQETFQHALACSSRILVAELLGTGQTAAMVEASPRDENIPTFFAFNHSLFSFRVQDVLTCLQLLREDGFTRLRLVAWGKSARPAAAALALADNMYEAVLDLKGVEDTPEAWLDKLDYHPLALRLGGLKHLLKLSKSKNLHLIHNFL